MAYFFLIGVFFIGYLAIILEHKVKLNKAAIAIFMAVASWAIFFSSRDFHLREGLHMLDMHLCQVAQVVFFLLGAMTIVELMDSHGSFTIITKFIQTKSQRKMLWLIGLVAFFLSAVLDNLTTTILIVSVLRKLIEQRSERLIFSCLVVVAANAGGAWTPIGDVTTTMLWIQGQLSSLSVMRSLFIPSLISLIIPLIYLTFQLKGKLSSTTQVDLKEKEPGAGIIFFLGIIGFIFVPIFKAWTGLPPFMGILIVLSFLWLITDNLHQSSQSRQHLRVPHIFTKIDLPSVLFFLGILLCVGALEEAHILEKIAQYLDSYSKNLIVVSSFIGIFSALIDNVPLVAATMGMYPLEQFPIDHSLWHMIAYAAGTGGSLLIIGSAAGVALMGIEKIDFLTYMKKMTFPAALGYFIGMITYLYV